MYKYRRVIASVIVLALLLVPAIRTWAATPADTGFNITTSPLPISLHTTPGSTVTTNLRVKNTGPRSERIKVSLMKFGATGDLGRPTIQDRGKGDDYFDWVKFSPSVFDAAPNVWIDVKMTIDVPKTAGLGYYYAVTFSPADKPTANGKSVVIGSTATLVLLDVQNGADKRQLVLASITADRKIYEFLPAVFSVKLHNSGNIHAVPTGNIFITKGKSQVATLDVNAAGGNILPNTNRVFTVQWKDGFPLYVDKTVNDQPVYGKNGQPERKLTWNFSQASKLKFGKYTAKAFLVYSDGQHDVPLQGTVSFWVIPWRILLALLLILLLVGIGIWSVGRTIWRSLRRKRKHNKDHDA
jgi:hypothetical protein